MGKIGVALRYARFEDCGLVISKVVETPKHKLRLGYGRGFTLLELLVVIAVLGILASLLLPSLAKGKQKAQGVYCLNNCRQLMLAITSYTTDYTDLFPPNPDDGNVLPGHNWCSGQAGVNGSAEFNPDILKDPTRSLLAPYLANQGSVFHCPGDKRMGRYQGTDPALIGRQIPAARTFSMSQAVGTICAGYDAELGTHSGKPNLSVNGRWLNGEGDHRRDTPWFTYGKLSTVRAPGPSLLWVLVDESTKGLNDAAFAFRMEQPGWIDAPGNYHNGGCGFAFADGHSETHRWVNRGEKIRSIVQIIDSSDRQDWVWMRARTSSRLEGLPNRP